MKMQRLGGALGIAVLAGTLFAHGVEARESAASGCIAEERRLMKR